MATINDCIMSLRKCEKLKAPSRLQRVGAALAWPISAAILLFIVTKLLATSLLVLRECAHETVRDAGVSARSGDAMGRARVHRGDRAGGIPWRDLARPVCA